MSKFISFFVFILMIFGCAGEKVIVHEPLKNELLAYTSKSEIIDGTDRTLIVATYLNPIYNSNLDASKEHFLVAINPKEHASELNNIKVNNDSNATNARLLDENDEILKFAGFSMPWALYYEVTAPSKQSDDLALSFEIYQSRPVLLNFRKAAKSLYWNQ
ncbi:hypothetical protein CCON61_02605 [Campylobacter concisus]|uniref:hypothetical protein n=1 Tax=Campylobacter concisus TaxID=199 RepID=UPI000A1ED43F|nr:hypothetical protein [Campylobacter concisus]OSQ25582.1 hypothetical protein CCON61_02605 [Campylobacter concisus]